MENFNERIDKKTGKAVDIDMLVMHCSAYPSDKLIQVFKDYGLSAHYIIDMDGSVTQLVEESKRAWHAGMGSWYGISDINSHSIGIEVINTSLGHTTPYTDEQIDSLKELSTQIIQRYQILPHNVFAHSDMTPARRYDPGRLFPWEALSKAGIGLYPLKNQPKVSEKNPKTLLAQIGYPVKNEASSLRSFVRHFMPEILPEKEDPEMEQFQFLLEYEKNLPKVLEKQSPPSKKQIERLQQVAFIFNQSRSK